MLPPLVCLGLRKVYANGKVAVDGLSVKLRDGECFGLLGPNGAGKTTAISMLTGLTAPTSGQAAICGYDLQEEIEQIYQRIGVCPQFDIVWPLLTVTESLRLYVRLKGVPHSMQSARVADHIRAVELDHVPHRLVGRLSGGMKRRVSLAIAFVGDSPVVRSRPDEQRCN